MSESWHRGRIIARTIAVGFLAFGGALAALYVLSMFKGIQPGPVLWGWATLHLGQGLAL
jgi:hypothetical protein